LRGWNAILFVGLALGVIALFIVVFIENSSWGLDWTTIAGWWILVIPFMLALAVALYGLPKSRGGII